MKNFLTLAAAMFIILCNLMAQSPEKFNYQAVARDASGQVLASQSVSLRLSILQGSDVGSVYYQEIHTTTTNAYGQLSVEVGNGTPDPMMGGFNAIIWSDGPYFLKTEMDPAGGSDYLSMGTSQLLSVPYALYAKSVGSIIEEDPSWDGSANPFAAIGRNGNVGIGVFPPQAQLHTTGTLRFAGAGTPGAGKVLTSDADGNASWESPTGGGGGSNWTLSGTDIYNSNTGNVGVGAVSPTQKLDIDGQIRIRGGNPGAGRILTSAADGAAYWNTPGAYLPGGAMGQTLRHNGTTWEATNTIMSNSSSEVAIGGPPLANNKLYISRLGTEYGAGYANIFARRTGSATASHGGTGWGRTSVDAAIKGFSYYGNNFSAGIAGYSDLDFANSAALLGSKTDATTFGALAFKDNNADVWAGYFSGNVNVTGALRLQGGSPGAGKVLTSDANGNASWQVGGLQLPFEGSVSHTGSAFKVVNNATATSGSDLAGWFEVNPDNQNGVGVYGIAASGIGVAGSGDAFGGYFLSDYIGVLGYGPLGVAGSTDIVGGSGVYGEAMSSTGASHGGKFVNESNEGIGVMGNANSTTGEAFGGWFQTASVDGEGARGQGPKTGIRGKATGLDGIGIIGEATRQSSTTIGVYGQTYSPNGTGVKGIAETTNDGAEVVGVEGVASIFSSLSIGVRGIGTTGVRGVGTSAEGGYFIGETTGLRGIASDPYEDNARGVYGYTASPDAFAGYFNGNTHVVGNFTASGTKSFLIDHPHAPANKYLYHYNTESPEPYNLYRGMVVLDALGTAVIELPAYFSDINTDFSYQLTPVGAAMPHLHIASEIGFNSFAIAGGVAGMKVSWQITALRNDPWVRDKGYQTEVVKPEHEQGTYIYPQGYGMPETLGRNYQEKLQHTTTVHHDLPFELNNESIHERCQTEGESMRIKEMLQHRPSFLSEKKDKEE